MIDDDEEHTPALLETGFWGRRGAGCIVFAKDTGRFLIGLRSMGVLESHTWGTWGGAVPNGMSSDASTLRELAEETGFEGEVELVLSYVFRDEASGFQYENFVAVVDEEFIPTLNWEHDDHLWVENGDWPDPLHFGLAKFLQEADLSTYLSAPRKPA